VFQFFKKKKRFQSDKYWETRYKAGGNSGAGSYNHLATFKADTINQLIKDHHFSSVIEFGCGDGNQLTLLQSDSYIGLDVSPSAIQLCKKRFQDDFSKSFFLYDYRCFRDNRGIFRMDCSMSLDVLYHLVEQQVYETYLRHLFHCASKMVIIYAANVEFPRKSDHELYREFTKDINKHIKGWKLDTIIKNKFPARDYEDQEGSLADFFIYTPV